MATLPRASKSPASSSFLRPQSEFDAGINTSTAWTQHRRVSDSLSDDEQDDNSDDTGDRRPARALYDFEGKSEFRELTVHAGDELEVVKEELADGWSLVSDANGEIGLLPRSYYTFTSEFTSVPDYDIASPATSSTFSKLKRKRDPSSGSITPRNSVASPEPTAPIIPQHTGEWMFPSFRQSLLGGKSLNRFSSFVTSGAEEWVLKGKAADTTVTSSNGFGEGTWSGHSFHEKLSSIASDEAGEAAEDDEDFDPDLAEAEEKAREISRLSRMGLHEADRHYVDAGHAWKSKLPPFRVLVHSPSKRSSVLSGAYTVYNVTSLFKSPASRTHMDNDEDEENPPPSPTRLTVQRRFSHFVILHTALSRRLPGIALPPLPEKQYAGRFSEDFVEARRGDLERYIGRIVRHPILRYAEVVTWFLSCESESEWKRLAPHHLTQPAAGPSFYAQVFHPAFNLDLEDAEEAVERFATHTRAVGQGVQGLRSIFGKVREARIEMSKSERLLSYSLLSLITSKPLASTGQTQIAGIAEEDEQEEDAPNMNGTLRPRDRYKGKGLMNEDGAWCWREGCQECLKLTKAMQRTAETLQSVADIYDDHARRTQLATHESLKSVAHPASVYAGVVSTHRSTLTRYREAGNTDEEMASRCETVLNTTMAEMETYHTQKVEDFATLVKEHLGGEIAMYEQILSRLRTAHASFSPSKPTSPLPTTTSSLSLSSAPRQPSIYERELENPRLNPAPLLQPCPHVFDSTPMRPVSVAVGSLLGSGYKGREGRGSILGNLFW